MGFDADRYRQGLMSVAAGYVVFAIARLFGALWAGCLARRLRR